jgi:hypothetical protein
MEKLFGEDDFQGLDKEIDAAVERLFVDKKNDQITFAHSDLLEHWNTAPSVYRTITGDKTRPLHDRR